MTFHLPPALAVDDDQIAIEHLRDYFGLAGGRPYTGAHFDRYAGGGDRPAVRDCIDSDDLVAVSMLSVEVPPRATLQITGTLQTEINELLRQVRTDIDLAEVDPDTIGPEWPAWRLWSLLEGLEGVGYVTASKLLARKRPRLLPVYDSVVRQRVGGPDDFWHSLCVALHRDNRLLHRRLERIRAAAGIGEDISVLRTFDVVAWMPGPGTP